MGVDRSDTSRGIVHRDPKEEEREIRKVVRRECATIVGSKDI